MRLYATLRKFLPNVDLVNGHTMQVTEGTTVTSLLEQIGVPVEMTKQVFVNARQVEFDYVVQPADRVAIFPPIAGGE
ncbi:MAG: MoaD/ThiS family protein [Chloroflexi bacterium]|nr:MoaD/ThiS family protein [Chloroflexota bacterium]